MKACYGRAASKAQPDRSRELADLNKRIKTTVALLSDSDLADVGELRAALVDLKRRRQILEADVANKPAPPIRATPSTSAPRPTHRSLNSRSPSSPARR